MRLMLLRHAKAEKAEGDTRDRDRGLTERGRRDACSIGAYLEHHALLADRIIVSPARRTRETWEQLATALSEPPPADSGDRLYDAATNTILTVIRECARPVPTLLVVGHNPGLHDAARLLIASGDTESRELLNENLPTCGLVIIDFAGDDWRRLHQDSGRLERFVTPRLLKAATD